MKVASPEKVQIVRHPDQLSREIKRTEGAHWIWPYTDYEPSHKYPSKQSLVKCGFLAKQPRQSGFHRIRLWLITGSPMLHLGLGRLSMNSRIRHILGQGFE